MKRRRRQRGHNEVWIEVFLITAVGMHYGLTVWQIMTGFYILLFIWCLVKGDKP